MTVLSVNVNKVAVLRNSRGHALPDPVDAARVALAAGAAGITVHPRPDQRHIRVDDLPRIAAVLGRAEYNIEGNPFAPARGSYPGLLGIARQVRPQQVTLVPDGDDQITSDHGFDPVADAGRLAPVVAAFKALGCRVSVFVDIGHRQFAPLKAAGVDRIEIHTGPWAAAFAAGDTRAVLGDCLATARAARDAGLGVNAGHDLDQQNLGALVAAIPFIEEVSIGHALFGEAIHQGLATTVQRYLAILAAPAGAAVR